MTPLVGRRAELVAADEAIVDAARGRGCVLLFSGEPGIGKTRLAEEVAARVVARGGTVAWGRCWEEGAAPAYWPWRQALRALEVEVPELAHDAGTQFEVLAAIAAAVRARAASVDGGALAIVLDDLHWADKGSLLALKLLARDLAGARVLLIGTYREIEAQLAPEIAKLLADVGREARTTPVRGLARDEVGELARAFGSSSAAVERLHDATQGNPFFVEEVLRLAAVEGTPLEGSGRTLPIPLGVRETIARRLALLSADTRRALDALAVLGKEADAAMVAAVASLPAANIGSVLDGVAARQIVMRRGLSVAFAHDLLREAVYTGMDADARASLHRAAAGALEQRGAEDDAAAIAHHLFAGDPATVDERAITWSERAGRRDVDAWAVESAAEHFARAVAVVDRRGEGATIRAAELALALGDARMRAGEIEPAREVTRRALEIARTHGDGKLFARAALVIMRPLVPGTVDPAMVRMLEEATTRLGTDSDARALSCRVRARLGAALQPTADPEVPLAMVRGAIVEARQLGPRALLAVIDVARAAFRQLEPYDERVGLLREMRDLGDALGDRDASIEARYVLAGFALERGNRAEAERMHTEIIELVRRRASPLHAINDLLLRGMFAAAAGDFQAALAAADEGSRDAAYWGRRFGGLSFVQRAGFAYSTARRNEVMAMLTVAADVPHRIGDGFVGLLSSLLPTGRDEALARIDKQVPHSLYDQAPLIGRYMIAESAVVFGTRHDRLLYDLLVDFADRHIVTAPVPLWFGSAERLVGGLAANLGRYDEAVSRIEASIVENERCGLRPWVARSKELLARTLLRRAAPGDAARAATLFAEARAVYAELSMDMLVERVDAAKVPAPPAPPPPSTSSATATFALDDGRWTVALGEHSARVDDADGMHYLAHLVANPDTEVHAIELLRVRGRASADTGDAGPVLDRAAKEAYRRRAAEIREQLEEADAWNDAGRRARAEEELESLEEELSRAVGLGGRDRKSGAASERARVNVTLRIKKAIAKVQTASPALGHHLLTCVKTGVFCRYTPPPRGK